MNSFFCHNCNSYAPLSFRDTQQGLPIDSDHKFRQPFRQLQGKFTFLVLVVALLSLSGCGTQTPRTYSVNAPAGWPDTQSQLRAFTHWQIQGKLAVSQPQRRDSVVINQWHQMGRQYDILVSSAFLGLGTTRISGTPDQLTIVQPDEPVISSSHPESLLESALGWSFPVNSLRYWIKGLPTPEFPAAITFDAEGNPFQITQAQWQVSLDRYQSLNGYILPTKITLSDGNIKIKVIVTAWTNSCKGCG